MIYKLVNAGVVGAYVRLGQLPQPTAGGVHRRREHPLRPAVAGSRRRKAQLDGDGLESLLLREEENGPSSVRLSPILRIDPIKEGHVGVMVVQDEKFVRLQRLYDVANSAEQNGK